MIIPVVPFNPVILLLHNQKTDRWHPILYWECPPPSGTLGEKLRWKSKGHHTKGFGTRLEAITGLMDICKSQYEKKEGGDVYYSTDVYQDWDGEETPASVVTFDLNKLTKYDV